MLGKTQLVLTMKGVNEQEEDQKTCQLLQATEKSATLARWFGRD